MKKKAPHTILYFLCACVISAHAQTFPTLQFNHITTVNGLSNNVTSSIVEDKQGFIWIATANGLNRYDGYRIKQYYHNDEDSNSIINNTITSLFCDSKGRIWASTNGGVSCFLPEKNIFINYSITSKNNHRLQRNNSTYFYEDDNDKTVWLANQDDYLLKINEDMGVTPVKLNAPSYLFDGILFSGYQHIYKDRDGNRWAFIANHLHLLQPGTWHIKHTYNLQPQIGGGGINQLLQDKNGHYWLITWGSGCYEFMPATGTLVKIKSLPLSNYLNMVEWAYHNQPLLLISDAFTGLHIIDKATNASVTINDNNSDPYSLKGTNFNWIYTDSHGTLWVNTNHGVSYVAAAKKIFEFYAINNPANTRVPNTTENMASFFEDEDSTLWVSKRYKQTYVYDKNMQLKKFYPTLFPINAAYPNRPLSSYFFLKKQNDLYISTDSGLLIYNYGTKKTAIYLADKFSIHSDFRNIVSLNDSELLIRSFSSGIFIFNTQHKKFTYNLRHKQDCSSCPPEYLNFLFKSAGGRIFLTSSQPGYELIEYLPTSKTVRNITPVNEDKYNFKGNLFFGLAEAKNGRLWMAGGNGIFAYNPQTNMLEEHYNGGGKMGQLFRVTVDTFQNIWCNGLSGIWSFNASAKKWLWYNGEDGLPGNSYEGFIGNKKNGDVIAGLEGMVAIFHQDGLNAEKQKGPAIITEAAVNDNVTQFPLLNSPPKKLVLQAGQNNLSVDFALLNYTSSSIQYFYKLLPADDSFQNNPSGHISFKALAPGHYTLVVKGGNKTGSLLSTEDILDITVEPQWQQSMIFKVSLLLLVSAGIVFFVRRRIKTIKRESSLRERIAETELQALQAQMNPHFIFNSLTSIENFIMENERKLASDYLNKFARLIRMILDSSRNVLVPITKDLEALQLYIDLEQLRFNNKFNYKAIIDPLVEEEDFNVPPLLLQPYVENAILHGFAASTAKNLLLTIKVSLQENMLHYVIEDNGIGREKAAMYRNKNKPSHKSVGMAITGNRILNFNKNKKEYINPVTVTDLYDDKGNAAGTRVELFIKAI